MAHIRLDDKHIELSMAEPRIGTGVRARGRPDAGQERWILEPALGTAAAPLDWECPTNGGNRAVVSREAPMLATLEVVTEGVSTHPLHRLHAPLAHIGRGNHTSVVAADDSLSGSPAGIQRCESEWFVADMDSTNETALSAECVRGGVQASDTAVRFRGAKVIFRSEPEFVDADGATDLLVIQDC